MSSAPQSFLPSSWEEFKESLANPKSVAPLEDAPFKISDHDERYAVFAGPESTAWKTMRDTWPLIIGASFVYIMLVKLIPRQMKNREPIKPKLIITLWNLILCIYSTIGTAVVVNQILFGEFGLMVHGSWYKVICTHSSWYCTGYSGIAILFFVLGKLPELVDTMWLLLARRDVNLLHSWHHFSVLLWSWHSYITATSLGLLFGYMNYQVHSIMYFYYAMTQISETTKGLVRPFAIYVTTIQIVQMFFGIFILSSAWYFKSFEGRECWADPTNNVLATICYSTYFVLFLDLYVQRYIYCSHKKGKKKKSQ